ncbi:unnamed protein product [Prunus armeniaca]|uniref:Uncharacterized protein n=1 Tax=Prunus armeniaca TaxID=36596 RepID=A0A6J5W1K1_PRUAR|nr:unnamed protein product [Prunus armeniaca]CAB4294323.1 unnamed protein product [Prunus armeniaca]
MADHPLVLQIHPPQPHLQRSSSTELGSELANSSSTTPPANPIATNLEQLVLQIGQSSTAPPQHEDILNLKVETATECHFVTQSNPAVHKMKINKNRKLSTARSLANLLPTGTVLAFQALTPSISYNGRCHTFNQYLVAFVILVCSVICFVSSFIDSLPWEGKVYYGFATSKGLCVLNDDDHEIDKNDDIQQELNVGKTTISD